MSTDQQTIKRLLKTAKGQVEGVLKMAEDGRGAIDISNQVLAAIAILKKVNREIVRNHIKKSANAACNDDQKHIKISEIILLIDKMRSDL